MNVWFPAVANSASACKILCKYSSYVLSDLQYARPVSKKQDSALTSMH